MYMRVKKTTSFELNSHGLGKHQHNPLLLWNCNSWFYYQSFLEPASKPLTVVHPGRKWENKMHLFAFYGEKILMIQQYLHCHIFNFVHGPTSQKLFICSEIHVVEVTQDDLESFLINEWSLCLAPGKMIRSLACLRKSYFRCSNMTILLKKVIGSIWKYSKGCFCFFFGILFNRKIINHFLSTTITLIISWSSKWPNIKSWPSFWRTSLHETLPNKSNEVDRVNSACSSEINCSLICSKWDHHLCSLSCLGKIGVCVCLCAFLHVCFDSSKEGAAQ